MKGIFFKPYNELETQFQQEKTMKMPFFQLKLQTNYSSWKMNRKMYPTRKGKKQ